MSRSLGELPSKLYFRIGEVAGLVGVEPHVLRYWEREFRSIRPTKSAKGQRVYSRRDVENLLRAGVEPNAQAHAGGGAAAQSSPSPGQVASPSQTPGASPSTTPASTPSVLPTVTAAPKPSTAPASGPMIPNARVHEKLSVLRAEVEAFLKELGG